MSDKLNAERLRALDAAATAGPWAYRPDEYDDWGVVKAAPYRPAGFEYDIRFVLAQFRDPAAADEEIEKAHRVAKTDPWRGNAELVSYLRNAVPAILAMAEENKELRDRLGFWAARQTCDEALADTSPTPWRNCSPEQRLAIIAANKEIHDGEVLKARRALGKEQS